MLEKEIERKLVEEIKNIGGMALKFNSSIRGMPDRIILLPEGRIYFAEMKRLGEKPRPLQLKRLRDLQDIGFSVHVLDSLEAIKAFIRLVR